MPQYSYEFLKETLHLTDEEITDLDVIHDVKCKLVRTYEDSDQYHIEREVHDNVKKYVPSYGGTITYWSRNLNPRSVIEGSVEEWLQISRAIRLKYTQHFKRCAVIFPDRKAGAYFKYSLPMDAVGFESPKTSNEGPFLMTYESALYLADQIDALLGKEWQ